MTDDRATAARFPVGLEEAVDGATHVHSFSIPGCAATGSNKEAALEAFAPVLSTWIRYLSEQGEASVPGSDELEIVVEEWISTAADVSSGESQACFEADRAPIGADELLNGLQRIGTLRGQLVPLVRRMSNEQLERIGDPQYTLRTILDELARAQWWVLTRLGASPLAQVPEGVVARLDTAMALVVQVLANLPPQARNRTLELEGEEWTARKVLRRLLWLEWSLGAAAIHALRSETRQANLR
ncbi:MAG: hypothetical protein GEU90_07800 [Gemmatimonas sp.]|nr:hypothetical protein [Gemmatimonas sp.]